jgi:hypothetical protein
MIERQLVSASVEPCRDTVEFVGEFAVERGERRWFSEKLPDDHAVIVEDITGTPCPDETTFLKFGATLAGQLESQTTSIAEAIESTLSAQGACESVGTITHVGCFLEALLVGQHGNSCNERGEEEIGFDCEAAYGSLDDTSVLLRINATGTRAHRHAELSSRARSGARWIASDASGASTKRDCSVNCFDHSVCHRPR